MSDAVPPPEPQLDAQERRLFAQGVAQFNAGLYFECHDTLEELWAGIRGPSRDFFQGLIQVAVACHHWTRGNSVGAASLAGRALKRFSKYPNRYFGFDLEGHRRCIERWQARLEAGAAAGAAAGAEPHGVTAWRFDGLA